jgi:hypothetical protein
MPHIGPFAVPGTFFKGCLHVHSTNSDGRLTPHEVIDWYHHRGYHFLAVTDHRASSDARRLGQDLITLAGIELDGVDPATGLYHLVGLGATAFRYPQPAPMMPLQSALRLLREQGALVALAHPYWSGQRSADLIEIEGAFALEVYNGGCQVDDAKGFSTVHWDDVLAAGRRLWGIAVDDAHWRNGSKDAGLGWVWVKARELTQVAILQALEAGLFYASSGPQIHDLVVERDEVWTRCSPAKCIDFVGNGFCSRRVSAEIGQTITEATVRLRSQQTYVRVACQDLDGCWAWSNPVFLSKSDGE